MGRPTNTELLEWAKRAATLKSRRERNRRRMRVKRHGADVRTLREWPELAGLHGTARELRRRQIERAEGRLFTDARRRWPQFAHLRGDKRAYDTAWQREARRESRALAEAAYREWAAENALLSRESKAKLKTKATAR